jgi:hypothetical protein
MEHYARVIFDGPLKMKLDESVFTNLELLESTQGAKVLHIPLPRMLNPAEADIFAEKLANYMFESGLNDFDIDISTDIEGDVLEETYTGDEFYEAYGIMHYNTDKIDEAEYQGRKVPLGKPMQGDVAKFKVYVKDPKTGNVKKVNFGDPNMKIKKSNPGARKSFRARHNCDNPGPRTKARYWSCRKW